MADNSVENKKANLVRLAEIAAECGLSVSEYMRQHPTGAKLLSNVIDPEVLVKNFLERGDVKAALLAQTEQDVDTAHQIRLLTELVVAGIEKLLPLIF